VSTDPVAFEIELVTDPINDDETERLVSRLPGWADSAGGLDARLDVLARYGIAVHRDRSDRPVVSQGVHRHGVVGGASRARQ
jgi:hypothetical protein